MSQVFEMLHTSLDVNKVCMHVHLCELIKLRCGGMQWFQENVFLVDATYICCNAHWNWYLWVIKSSITQTGSERILINFQQFHRSNISNECKFAAFTILIEFTNPNMESSAVFRTDSKQPLINTIPLTSTWFTFQWYAIFTKTFNLLEHIIGV